MPPTSRAAHFQAAQAACSTVAYMMRAGEGPTWSLAEARALLQQAGGFLKLSKPWLWFRSPLLDDVKALTRQVEEAAATRPGAERLPATGAMEDFAFPQNQPSAPCDACGMHSQKLRRCAACKTAAYCSRECQVKHWKQVRCCRLLAGAVGAQQMCCNEVAWQPGQGGTCRHASLALPSAHQQHTNLAPTLSPTHPPTRRGTRPSAPSWRRSAAAAAAAGRRDAASARRAAAGGWLAGAGTVCMRAQADLCMLL